MNISGKLGLFLVSVLSGLAIVAWLSVGRNAPDRPMCKDCNVIIVSLDTLSGEHLPCAGYFRNTAPNLCAFAAKNIFFPNAFANATYTLPTHVTMFTGLLPSEHGIREAGRGKLSEGIPFLPSILKDAGYRTIFAMDTDNPHMPTDRVYYRGIDTFIDQDDTSWEEPLTAFRESVASGDKTMLFLHSYATHPPFRDLRSPRLYTDNDVDWMLLKETDVRDITADFVAFIERGLELDLADGLYSDPAPYERLLTALRNDSGDLRKRKQAILAHPAILEEYRDKYDPLIRIDTADIGQLDDLRAVYDQKIRELDDGLLQRLLSVVSAPGIRENTLVIITSDHGEDLGEHGYISHTTLYNPNTQVVLIMAIPGIQNRIVPDAVQTADITPTLLGILGVSAPGRFQGERVFPMRPGRGRVLVAEGARRITLRRGPWKLFVDTRTDEFVPIELYNMVADPGEEQNVLFTNMSEAGNMLDAYRLFRSEWGK